MSAGNDGGETAAGGFGVEQPVVVTERSIAAAGDATAMVLRDGMLLPAKVCVDGAAKRRDPLEPSHSHQS